MAGRIVAVLFAIVFATLGAVFLFRARPVQRWDIARLEKYPFYGIPILDRLMLHYARSRCYVWELRFIGGLFFLISGVIIYAVVFLWSDP